MANLPIDLKSRLCTNSEALTQTFEKPSFEYKNNIYFNGVISNVYVKAGKGVLLTSGKHLKIKQANDGAALEDGKKTYKLPFKYLLKDHTQIKPQLAGEMICHTLWKDLIYSVYKNGETYSLVIVDKENNLIKQQDLDCNSAIISSVYRLKDEPILFTVKTTEVGEDLYENHICGYNITNTEEPFLTHDTEDFIPLGDANSATIRLINGIKCYMFGCENIDKNRARTFIWSMRGRDDDKTKAREKKWFGTVSVRGDITGEPIPDPDTMPEPSRQKNGTYIWQLWDNAKKKFASYDLIGGYYVNELTNKLEPIVITHVQGGTAGTNIKTNAHSIRTNISENDKKYDDTDKSEYYPLAYMTTNYADSQDVYYSYGPGWLKTYIRDTSTRDPAATSGNGKIYDMYLWTFGCKTNNFLESAMLDGRIRKESLMAKGKVKEWDFNYGKLNQRVYTVGDVNKGTNSMLATIPFTVEVLPSTNHGTNQNERHLDMQMYHLMPLSFSYSKSLVTTASNDNSPHFTVIADDYDNNRTVLAVNDEIYEIQKYTDYSTAWEDLKIDKIADYNYRCNILDNKNLVTEDRFGNVEIVRSFYPYNMEAILDIEDLKLDIPSANETDSNNLWYWAAGNNIQLTEGNSTSYMLPAIAVPLFIDPPQLDTFAEEALENRGSILQPLVKGLYDNYESIDTYYTLTTTSTTVYYKTTNTVKVSSGNPKYSLYGKETYNIQKEGTNYWPQTSNTLMVIFPVGNGSNMSGINYITPTVDLLNNYACRLFTQNNKLFMVYNYANQIYYGNQIFTIYGGNYYYDGQGIYYIGQDNIYTSNQFVCYALGLKFLSNSGSEAYFYSDWEKRLFIFTGSNTMQPSDSLTNIGTVIDSIYSSKEQMLYMLTDDRKLIMRSQTDTAGIVDIPEGSKLIGTSDGCGVVYKDGFMVFSPRKREGYNYLPYKLETEYLGMEGKLIRCNAIDVLIYNMEDPKTTTTIKMKVHTLNGIEQKEEEQIFTITPRDWKGRTYRCRITPRVNTGHAFQVGIESENKTAVSFISFDVDDLQNKGAAPKGNRR